MITIKSHAETLDRYHNLHSNSKIPVSQVHEGNGHAILELPAAEIQAQAGSHSPEDLAYSFRFLLGIGRLIGVLPLEGVLTGKTEKLQFCWISFPVLASILISISLAINLVVGLSGFFKSVHENAKDLAFNCHMALFYGTALFIYTYMLIYSRQLVRVFKVWNESRFNYSLGDPSLRRDVLISTIAIYVSIILENATWHVKHFMTRDENGWTSTARLFPMFKKNLTALESFYATSEPDWSTQVGYHPALAIFIIVTNKWALYSWNFVEILLIVMSRAIYFKFKTLTQAAMEDTDLEGKWGRLIRDHSVLCNILQEIDQFLSPLVMLSFFNNIYNVCVHISLELAATEETTLIGSIYSNWSFLHLTFRFYAVCIAASRINIYATGVHTMLRKCPVELYTKEVKKYEKQLYYAGAGAAAGDGGDPGAGVGLTGMGYFIITKPTMLKILGVIFTVEIVLLQTPTRVSPMN